MMKYVAILLFILTHAACGRSTPQPYIPVAPQECQLEARYNALRAELEELTTRQTELTHIAAQQRRDIAEATPQGQQATEIVANVHAFLESADAFQLEEILHGTSVAQAAFDHDYSIISNRYAIAHAFYPNGHLAATVLFIHRRWWEEIDDQWIMLSNWEMVRYDAGNGFVGFSTHAW